MRSLKLTAGVLGLILFIAGIVGNIVTYFKLKKQGVKYVFRYVKANPDKIKDAKKWGFVGSIGFWLMLTASYMND